ncbi:MAG: hypothetical protein MZU91_02615 [Desulfosudis oleivorans]|nr:hypothetical protein [Desulfosudis oleivorans]
MAVARAASTCGPAAAVPVRQLQRAHAARSAPEPAQRRQADLQRPRLPGVLHLPHRRRDLLRVHDDRKRGQQQAPRDRHQEVRQDSGQRGRRGRVRHAHQEGPRGHGLPGRGGGPLRLRQEDRATASTARPRTGTTPRPGSTRSKASSYTTDELLRLLQGPHARTTPSYPSRTPLRKTTSKGFVRATKELGIQIVGDDFYCTNPDRIRARAPKGAANALLWKFNQIGTLSEALDAAELAYRQGFGIMVSERSGETEDPIIADFVVGINAGQIKTGAGVRGERTAKYNRLLQHRGRAGVPGRLCREELQGCILMIVGDHDKGELRGDLSPGIIATPSL